MLFNIPNSLTALRIILVPIVIILHSFNYMYLSLFIFIFLVITDFLDGYFARRLNQTTTFGAIFDPIADKVVAIIFYSYIYVNNLTPEWFSIILIIRNISQIMSLPILSWWLKKEFFVRPSRFAKWATAISDFFIVIPLFDISFITSRDNLYTIIMFLIASIEIKILITYIPRLIQIAKGTHDTFE